VIKKAQTKWYCQILVQGRFLASTLLFLVKGRRFSGVNKVQRSDNTNFFVSLYKERLDGQPLLLLPFANNLTAVPDTTDDIFALQHFLCGLMHLSMLSPTTPPPGLTRGFDGDLTF